MVQVLGTGVCGPIRVLLLHARGNLWSFRTPTHPMLGKHLSLIEELTECPWGHVPAVLLLALGSLVRPWRQGWGQSLRATYECHHLFILHEVFVKFAQGTEMVPDTEDIK